MTFLAAVPCFESTREVRCLYLAEWIFVPNAGFAGASPKRMGHITSWVVLTGQEIHLLLLCPPCLISEQGPQAKVDGVVWARQGQGMWGNALGGGGGLVLRQ